MAESRETVWRSRSVAETAGGNPAANLCADGQKSHTRTRIRNLIAMGTRKADAILTGLSRKGYWHLARTLATQTGMTNTWLRDQPTEGRRPAAWLERSVNDSYRYGTCGFRFTTRTTPGQ